MRKLLAVVSALALSFCSCFTSFAAQTLPISYSNSYSYRQVGGAITSIQCLSLVTMKLR